MFQIFVNWRNSGGALGIDHRWFLRRGNAALVAIDFDALAFIENILMLQQRFIFSLKDFF